jgi:hypothetical protein
VEVGSETDQLLLIIVVIFAQGSVKFAPGSLGKSEKGLEMPTKAAGRSMLGVTR